MGVIHNSWLSFHGLFYVFLASFLIPYFVMLAFVGIPLYYLELCLGQRMRKGSIGVWNEISPYLGGVGFSSVVVCFLVSLYYNVIIAWCVFYFVNSFQDPLPWSSCPTEVVHIGNTYVLGARGSWFGCV